MTTASPTVHVIDDDPAWRTSVKRLLSVHGYPVAVHQSAAEFLAAAASQQPGCILLDVRMPGVDGLELQDRLSQMRDALPIVFVTAYGDVPATVQAIKLGAEDFLIKTAPHGVLLDAIERAIARDREARSRRAGENEALARYNSLTAREKETFALVVTGKRNKQVAYELRTSERTVKFHRRNVMLKLGVASFAALVSFADRLDIQPRASPGESAK
jgi:FixJ family two-component response regulator